MALLCPERLGAVNPRKEPDYSYIHKELAKSGVNLTLLWTEYCSTCNAEGNIPYMYSQFCDKYRRWARVTKATMRIKHKPDEVMQVDWTGTTIPYQDPRPMLPIFLQPFFPAAVMRMWKPAKI